MLLDVSVTSVWWVCTTPNAVISIIGLDWNNHVNYTFHLISLFFFKYIFLFLSLPLHKPVNVCVQPNCWWDSEAQLCRSCQCSARGSVSQRCDSEGRCICRAGYVGRRCDLMRPPHARRETRRPVQQVPIQHIQRWESRGGCPRGAYRPGTGVNARHDGCTGSMCVCDQHLIWALPV